MKHGERYLRKSKAKKVVDGGCGLLLPLIQLCIFLSLLVRLRFLRITCRKVRQGIINADRYVIYKSLREKILIAFVTGRTKRLIREYEQIIEEYKNGNYNMKQLLKQ